MFIIIHIFSCLLIWLAFHEDTSDNWVSNYHKQPLQDIQINEIYFSAFYMVILSINSSSSTDIVPVNLSERLIIIVINSIFYILLAYNLINIGYYFFER